eukprot:Nk52_evm1s2657 gene=Nk52_evmTU1s2657
MTISDSYESDSYNDSFDSDEDFSWMLDVPIPSTEQMHALNLARTGQNLFLTGGPGTGKSELIRLLKNNMSRVDLTATTGIAASQINGRTVQSFFGTGLGKGSVETLVDSIRNSELQAARPEIVILFVGGARYETPTPKYSKC